VPLRIAYRQAQLQLKVFAPVLAVDQGQSFVGSPSFTVPVLDFAIPEISLFKDVKHSGHAEVKIYTIDAVTGKFVDQSPKPCEEYLYSPGSVNHPNNQLLLQYLSLLQAE